MDIDETGVSLVKDKVDGIDCVVIDSFSARVDMVEQVHNFSSGRVLVKGVIRHDFYSIFEQLEDIGFVISVLDNDPVLVLRVIVILSQTPPHLGRYGTGPQDLVFLLQLDEAEVLLQSTVGRIPIR